MPTFENSLPILINAGVIERFLNSASLTVGVVVLSSFLQATNKDVVVRKKTTAKFRFLFNIDLFFCKSIAITIPEYYTFFK
jgi:hypothetical protein